MGKTLSFSDIGPRFGAHLRSFFTSTVFFFGLTAVTFGCAARTASPRIDTSTAPQIEGMVWVPGGPFLMGTNAVDDKDRGLQLGFPQPWYEDERPQFSVDLPGFYIDSYEVTQGDYLLFIEATQHELPQHWKDGHYAEGRDNHPISFVDWYDSNDYCRWLGKRLPTEAEWEKAARGSEGRRYPWGDMFDPSKAHLSPNSDVLMHAAPVGRYQTGVSVYGGYDMIGNVWEWTESWYLAYPGSILRKPEFGMKHRVVRGLSYHSLGHYAGGAYPEVLASYARAGTRSYDPPAEKLEDLGFRCVKRVPIR